MKKLFALAIIGCLMVAVCGCTSKSDRELDAAINAAGEAARNTQELIEQHRQDMIDFQAAINGTKRR